MKQPIYLFEHHEELKPRRIITSSDLRPINNLKTVFREVRDYFAGNVTGITRDESIAQNIMRLLFCKIYDEKTRPYIVEFANRPDENSDLLESRIANLFERVKEIYPDLFNTNEKIDINPNDLSFIVSKIEDYSILDADRDVIGDAFEELIGTSFRGGEGQFFTPRNVVQMMIDILAPKEGEKIIDPACGSGGFLAYTLKHLLAQGNDKFDIIGIDKDSFLAKIARIYLSLIGDTDYPIYCENSLDVPNRWNDDAKNDLHLGGFDIVMTNPPFGAKIPVVGSRLLSQYELGHRWRRAGGWHKTDKLLDKQAPQVLFIERCIQLLRDGGRLGIVLPEGVFGNPSDRYIWEYITSVCSVTGIVSLPQETFQPSTHTKTSVLFLEKTKYGHHSLFMAIANSIGHNKNGKPIYKIDTETGENILDDDVPVITENFKNKESSEGNRNGFLVGYSDLNESIFIPEYYNPEIRKELDLLRDSGDYDLISIENLITQNVLQIRRGNEIGSRFYGTGKIPFVRTSDIVNWEIKFDPIKAVAEEVYRRYRHSQDIQEEDILFVSDGTFLIGRTAMVTKLDLKIIIQSHLKKIRVLQKDFIDPYYLFYLMNSKIVRKQIDSKTFVQATISTIGNRIEELVLPINKDINQRVNISQDIKRIITQKAVLRADAVRIIDSSV